MADSDTTGTDFEPGANDEDQHGWAPGALGTGEAKDQAIAGHKKAFRGNGTQDAATGAAVQGSDLTGGHVGQSTTGRGEEMPWRGRAGSRDGSAGHRKAHPGGPPAIPPRAIPPVSTRSSPWTTTLPARRAATRAADEQGADHGQADSWTT